MKPFTCNISSRSTPGTVFYILQHKLGEYPQKNTLGENLPILIFKNLLVRQKFCAKYMWLTTYLVLIIPRRQPTTPTLYFTTGTRLHVSWPGKRTPDWALQRATPTHHITYLPDSKFHRLETWNYQVQVSHSPKFVRNTPISYSYRVLAGTWYLVPGTYYCRLRKTTNPKPRLLRCSLLLPVVLQHLQPIRVQQYNSIMYHIRQVILYESTFRSHASFLGTEPANPLFFLFFAFILLLLLFSH